MPGGGHVLAGLGQLLRGIFVKQFDEHGFVFFSNYERRKGRELAANPRAALLFYWDPLGRQVRIEGPVARTRAGFVKSRWRTIRILSVTSQ